jgi:serine/threonine protein phosphatase PrpC
MLGKNILEFSLKAPLKQIIQKHQVGPRFMKISACLLPGQDPKGVENKICQDNFHVLATEGTLFCMLFDGHGYEGHSISEFCVNFVSNFVISHFQDFVHNPKVAVVQALEDCDKAVKESAINCDLSGSTGILIFISENSIHSGCIGDSRAILGTLNDSIFPMNKYRNPNARNYTVQRMLKPIPLTIDQKPDNAEESVRIKQAGGHIERFKDGFSPDGHCRVILPDAESALSMTRSIGDRLGKKYGILGTPEYRYFSMYSNLDQYIVIASDGIWDVMDNLEVLNFIEMLKDKCTDLEYNDYPSNNKNSTIARMLSEECRYRWLYHVQSEGVVIDDISVIVIDFSKEHESLYGSMSGDALRRYTKPLKHLG